MFQAQLCNYFTWPCVLSTAVPCWVLHTSNMDCDITHHVKSHHMLSLHVIKQPDLPPLTRPSRTRRSETPQRALDRRGPRQQRRKCPSLSRKGPSPHRSAPPAAELAPRPQNATATGRNRPHHAGKRADAPQDAIGRRVPCPQRKNNLLEPKWALPRPSSSPRAKQHPGTRPPRVETTTGRNRTPRVGKRADAKQQSGRCRRRAKREGSE